VTTQFFERQKNQRKYTRWLLIAFALAILLVIAAVDLVVVLALGSDPTRVLEREPELIYWTSGIVLAVVLISSWHKAYDLRSGGPTVAKTLGGELVTSETTDLKRKQLLNVVEEMAIAARVRKPYVYVLPDEDGINAFAAGNSPEDAVIAVTEGALATFDREQLQAVIGHEFSHILNGDMQLNMRLTAWIFGLYVITNIGRRIMRARFRGKRDGRLWIAAFGIFVAGSVGMFAGRLLQAAVSRRREYLADASAIQFTRNPGALESAFVAIAANSRGTRIEHPSAANFSHMFFAGSDVQWLSKFGGSWFATHPPVEERVRAMDSKITPTRFKSLISEARRKLATQAKREAAEADAEVAANEAGAAKAQQVLGAFATLSMDDALEQVPMPVVAAAASSPVRALAANANAPVPGAPRALALAETLPSGVRPVAGRALPPDLLRNRLSSDQQAAIVNYVAAVEPSPRAAQALFVVAMLAAEPAKWRTQLVRLAPTLGIDLMREVNAQIPRFAALAPAARTPLIADLLATLESLDRAEAKKLRAIARAFAPTVAAGDGLRWMVTRVLEQRLGGVAKSEPDGAASAVPLAERAPLVGVLYAVLAQGRFGVGKQGNNAYRAGLMGMLPPQKWPPYAEALIEHAALDAAVTQLAQLHPTAKRSLSEGMARVIAVGGKLTVAQVDYLRGSCLLIGCQLPLIPVEVVYDDGEPGLAAQASAR
jgi:Zn-dependent protease with chaperone function